MDSLLSVKPGLVFWTAVNFGIFLFLALKFGLGSILKGLRSREDHIRESIESAEKSNAEAKALLEEAQKKIDGAQKEMSDIIAKGRQQADLHISKASEEAEQIKKQKLEDAMKQIEISKNAAIKELRNEVAELVVIATEKLIDEKLDKEKDSKMIESYIQKFSNN